MTDLPERIDRFVVDRRLATGGMAEILLAHEPMAPGVDRPVVVKLLRRDKTDDEEFLTMFFDEARLLARLSHPNVATLFAAGQVDDRPYLAMEYVEGVSLFALLAAASHTPQQTLDTRVALSIACSLAETLAYVHSACDEDGRPLYIIHRDLTPSNVVVGRSGIVKLIDFGIARGENRVYETATGVVKGTCGYMAPEQLVDDEDVRLDHRVDVFSFGVMLYEILVGAHPFHVRQPVELVDRILEVSFSPPRQARSSVSEPMDALVRACMAREPDARPQDMGRIAGALRDELTRLGGPRLTGEIGAAVSTMFPEPTDADEAAPRQPVRRPDAVTEVDEG